MKTSIVAAMLLSLVGVLGCASPPGGGVGSGEEFKIVTPAFGATIKQGDTQTVSVTLHRGEYFKRDVTLAINASKGISVDPAQVLVKASEPPEVALRITVPSDAAIGKYKVFLKGTPATGEATSTEIIVKVVAP